MRYEAGKDAITKKLQLLDENGNLVPSCCAFDTDEGYYECWIMDPDRPQLAKTGWVDGKKQCLKEKIHRPFTVIYRDTKALFAWS